MRSRESDIVCEILAPDAALAAALGCVVETCARDTAQPVVVRALPCGGPPPVLTLRLPVELAAGQHQAWCLACRLACFCPDVRVGVLIEGGPAFAPSKPARRRRSA